ncbi:alpha-hydroxy-acid oxidizing protein [Bradyrhizobium sp. 190]|uniref:alpha-hydroxy acid oxidase n=1 Tax=Bradyrhizobium sp. 190 TaxID=2782658 RepID=UPI001FFA76C8|nr:alpha-hydroxy acid oxidase [Bradyrhizobium sp. 190]MCK1516948.1 alpha-hydroxy-acid oxidizing protein [Bradyrhizobium sp. 190]
MKHITCIEDLRALHKRRVPKAFFDYCDRGSYAEETLRANRDDLQHIKFRQRILVDVSKRDTSTMILGEPSTLPLILAPVGLLGMQHGDGEIYACRAAQATGIPFTQSTFSICSIEDIATNVEKPFWFQLYVMKDRGFIKDLIQRAIASNCSALVLTVDLQVPAQRHADIRNGMSVPPEWSLSKFIDFATKPTWVSGVLRGKRRTFGNIAGHAKSTEDLNRLAEWTASQFDTTLNWQDVDWIRSIWPGKLVIKGILDVEDAEEAAKTGAHAIVVSNHGGRQLDGAPSSIEMLPEIVDAVGDKIEIMFDGGIRSGQDMMRALALGAKSCMIGRAYAHGLGAGGQAGVAKSIDIIRRELLTTMSLCGVNTVDEIDDRVLCGMKSDGRSQPAR